MFVDLRSQTLRRKGLVELRGPGMPLIKKQLDLVAAYADLRIDRLAEVEAQTGPPSTFWASLVGLQAHRHSKTLQMMSLAYALSIHVHMRFKQIFAIPRPVELSPQIQPMIATPGHSSWPSGHATEAFAVATLLQALLEASHAGNGDAYHEQMQRLAARVATNRTVAGLHYPVDSAAGRLLGTALGEFLVARCTGGKLHERGFDATGFVDHGGAPLDFSLHQDLNKGHGYSIGSSTIAVPHTPLLAWLWREAVKEWH